MFSFGAFLFELFEGDIPFVEQDDAAVLAQLSSSDGLALGPIYHADRRITKLVQQCRERNPSSRPNAVLASNTLMDLNDPERWDIRLEDLEMVRELGSGHFGVVNQMKLKDTNTLVAVKQLKSAEGLQMQEFRGEMSLLKKVRHPNIVSMFKCSENEPQLIVLEYLSGGSLVDWLRNEPEAAPLELLFLIHQVALGCAFLSDCDIVHRDLAARNILVGSSLQEVKGATEL